MICLLLARLSFYIFLQNCRYNRFEDFEKSWIYKLLDVTGE